VQNYFLKKRLDVGFLSRLFNLSSDNEDTTVAPSLSNLKVGDMLKYIGYDWIVESIQKGVYLNTPYTEYVIESELNDVRFLIKESCRVYSNIPIGKVLDKLGIRQDIRKLLADDEPPRVITYLGSPYEFNAKGPCKQEDTDYLCYEYINTSESHFVWFQQWDDTDFTCCPGAFENENAFDVLGSTT
jgi:hypothetical protein